MPDSNHSSRPSDSAITLDEIRHEKNKWILAGIIFVPTLPIFLFVAYFLSVDPAIYVLGIFLSAMMTFVGLGLLQKSYSWSDYFICAQALQKSFAPQVTITKEYAAAKHGNTYIFALKGGTYRLYFAALKQSSIVPSEKIRVPGITWKWVSAYDFQAGLALKDAEGTFSTPTPEGNIISGEGLVLCLRNTPFSRAQFTEESLHKVAEYADKCLSERPDEGRLKSLDE